MSNRHITDEQIDALLYTLNDIAASYNRDEYGLPLGCSDVKEKPHDKMRAAVRAALAAPAPAVPSDERAAFEAWARPHGYDLRRNAVLGHYSSLDTLRAWEGWQARAALTAAPTPSQEAVVPSNRWLTAAVDAAMVEMKNISPPMRRSECERLIRAALTAAPTPPAQPAVPEQQVRNEQIAFSLEGHVRTLKLAKRYDGLVEDMEKAIHALTSPAQPKCLTCNGHGLIGGHMQDGSGYAEGCPDCNPEPAVPEDVARDAERYRWLREQEWFSGPLCVLRDPKRVLTRGIGLGADCPSGGRLDAAIDAAHLKNTP